MRTTRAWFCASLIATACLSTYSQASTDPLIEGAKLCTQYLPRHERQYGIPVHLLAAIASTESGRFHKSLGLNLPWPWTINVEGKGYFFDTKQQAIDAVRKFQARGMKSIDVGCMQVNLHHHPRAFSSLEQAFDPAYNVAYGAQFLKQNFQEEGSWRKATGDYHSRTPMFGEQYARLVFGSWSRIINKVADARAGRPLMANRDIINASAIQYHDKQAATDAGTIMQRVQSKPSRQFAKASNYRSLRMHHISVANDTTRERGVLVIRPQRAEATQQAKLDESFVTQQARKETTAVITPTKPEPAAAVQPDKSGIRVVDVKNGRVVSSKGQFMPSAQRLAKNVSLSAAATAFPKNAFIFDN